MFIDPVIIALDFKTAAEADKLVIALDDSASFYKVGLELYAASGMDYVHRLLGRGKRVFLDLKFYDIGETVKRAVAQIAESSVTCLSVHGVPQVVRAAVEGRGESALQLLAVTVLTSLDQSDIEADGHTIPLAELVDLRVQNAVAAGADGLICSPREAARIRGICGPKPLIVTPGVRSKGAETGDQKRIATPVGAVRDGANYIVIGRQVTRSTDPAAALAQIHRELM